MNTLQKINYLIDQHVDIPYVACPGCKACQEIEEISKASGLWLRDSSNENISKGKKRIKNFTKEQLKQYLDDGLTIKEICAKEKFTYNTVKRKIYKWFPEYYEQKNKDLIKIDRFITLKKKGLSIPKIADLENVSRRKLFYQVRKWKNSGKLTDEAI